MKSLILLFCLFSTAVVAQQEKITTLILVRHAEKASDGKDPELSEAGVARAQRLAAFLSNTAIGAVYSTNYKRTQNTVAQIAREKNLSITNYELMTLDHLRELTNRFAGKTILIAGHSNTIPQIANALLGRSQFQTFSDSEYGTILILSVVDAGKNASVLHLTY